MSGKKNVKKKNSEKTIPKEKFPQKKILKKKLLNKKILKKKISKKKFPNKNPPSKKNSWKKMQPSAGTRKKPPVGGLNFLVIIKDFYAVSCFLHILLSYLNFQLESDAWSLGWTWSLLV